jgi:uncharacterized cofD-like protein
MSTSRATLPRRSQSSRPIVVLGRGPGLVRVLKALRGRDSDLTAIVNIAYDEDPCREAQDHRARTVGDLRRSLEVLTREEGALLRAIRRPVAVGRVSEQPLGNLVLGSVASAFGDYGAASRWLGEQLGVAGAVLPATTQPVPRRLELVEERTSRGRGGSRHGLTRLSFGSEEVKTPAAAVAAIEQARWVVLAPGSLYRSVLSTAAVPDLACVLSGTRARVVWIANLDPATSEASDTTGIDHLHALRLHGIRTDAVLHDPSATIRFDAPPLESYGVESVPRALRSTNRSSVHDPDRLRAAIREMIESSAPATAR